MSQEGHPLEHPHVHRIHRSGWLRAAVMGANDGLVSTASLVMAVVAAQANQDTVMLTGVAGLVAGAMSMAAGEYASVSTQADTEKADLEVERIALSENLEYELQELAIIYCDRGLDADLAHEVAAQLMEHDALGAHARDELGILDWNGAKPGQAAIASGISFAVGAGLPLGVVLAGFAENQMTIIAGSTLVFLAVLGALAARAGGANQMVGALRVTLLGGLAMAVTSIVGGLIGTTL
ncbi:MAG: VIT1/CCC1 family predicted Fe2+/Mn2+ transporter [Glaciecola sp.]|jgi:VIT1/CCC1 family predicted Fe2+/Mn2+ transporter